MVLQAGGAPPPNLSFLASPKKSCSFGRVLGTMYGTILTYITAKAPLPGSSPTCRSCREMQDDRLAK